MKIDLDNYRTSTSKVFSGRNRGKAVRESLNLDELDEKDDVIIIEVPDDIYSINTSFFLGVFGESVRNLGKEKFTEKYVFRCPDIIQEDIQEGIERALKDKTVV